MHEFQTVARIRKANVTNFKAYQDWYSQRDVDADFVPYVVIAADHIIIHGEHWADVEVALQKMEVDSAYIEALYTKVRDDIVKTTLMLAPHITFKELIMVAMSNDKVDELILTEYDLNYSRNDPLKLKDRFPFENLEEYRKRLFKLVRPVAVAKRLELTNVETMYSDPIQIYDYPTTLGEYLDITRATATIRKKFEEVVKGNKRMADQVKKMEKLFESF